MGSCGKARSAGDPNRFGSPLATEILPSIVANAQRHYILGEESAEPKFI
jgi:hypothetical protein